MIRRSASCMACGLTAFVLLIALFVPATGWAPGRHLEALLLLREMAAPDAASSLRPMTGPPLRQALTYTVAGRAHRADLYLSAPLDTCAPTENKETERKPGLGGNCPAAALVAVPGVTAQGKDDPRLAAFVATLARAGFAVLVPEIEGFREMRIRPADVREIADAFAYVISRPELAPQGRAGMFAFSYSAGPALLAALEPDIREKVRFVAGVGGYHDLMRTMRFFTTGWFEHEGRWSYLLPDDSGKMVLLYSSLGYLPEGDDHAVFDRMVELRLRDPRADLAEPAARLSAEARTVYALAVNNDPARFPELFARLPEAMRADLTRLNLARHDLKALKARLLLVHGRDDNLIPFPESLALAAAAPEGRADVFLIRRVLGHVELSFSHLQSWRFWSQDLPDLWRLWRAVDWLLAQREVVA